MAKAAASESARTGRDGWRTDRLGFLLAAGVIAFSALAGLFALPRISLSAREKQKVEAPAFNLPVLHNGTPGSRLDLADLKGKAVLVDFWATWCGPCAMQTPVLDRIAKRYGDRGLVVVGVNVLDDDRRAAQRYAEKKQLSYPIVVDDAGLTQRAYAVERLPSLILIDRDGKVVHKASGFVDEASLDRLVRGVL